MTTVRDRGAVTPVGRGRPGATRPSPLPTTLYDLITAIQDVLGPSRLHFGHRIGQGCDIHCHGAHWIATVAHRRAQHLRHSRAVLPRLR
jgi:hypothetical protein